MIETITSLADRRLELFGAVRDPDLARSHGLFIAEGRIVLRRVLEDGRFRVRSVLVNDSAYRDLEPLLAQLDVPVLLCRTEDFTAITGFNIHRGCLALVERPDATSIPDLIDNARRLVVLDGVGNADNVGGIFRNALAFGVDAVLLRVDCCDPWYRKAIRTSMAAVLRVPFARSGEWSADLARVRAAGFTIVVLTPAADAESIDDFASRAGGQRLALAFGAEGAGVTAETLAAADARVRIPIAAGVDSLNVAVAAGIALHALRS